MIPVSEDILLDESEIQFHFIRASGPGGQNVNKVASAVQLRFDVKHSPSLPEAVRSRLLQLGGKKLSRDGVLTIEAARYRKQAQNRQDAVNRLTALILQATRKPKRRIRTSPSKASKERLREAKRHRSHIKKMRRPVNSTKD